MVDEEMVQVTNGAGGGSRRFSWWGVVVVVLVAVAVMYKLQPFSGGVVWGSDYQKGLELAKQANKPILLAFYSTGCPYCEQMKRTTYKNSEVIKLVDESFVPIMLNADHEVDIARRFVQLGFPSYTVLNPDGSYVETFEGYLSAKDYMEQLTGALGKVSGVALSKAPPNKFGGGTRRIESKRDSSLRSE